MFLEKYSDVVLIDGTRKTNIYDLSLFVTTVVDSLDILFPVGFLVAPSENSSLIESHLDYLKIGSNPSHNIYGSTSCVILIDEGLALIDVASSIIDYNHCMYSFHVN